MPRDRRRWTPGRPVHAISRFVDRRFHLFDEAGRRTMLDAMARAQERWDWRWLSYGLMSSHTHHGLLAGDVDPERFYQSVHTSFSARLHLRSEGATLGPVMAARPKFHPVHTQASLQRMVAYHHRNPTEAGLVERPRDSRRTSHRAYLRLDPAPPFLDVEWALDFLGFQDTEAGRRRFDDFVSELALDDYRPADEAAHRDEPIGLLDRQGPQEVDWASLEVAARNVVGLGSQEPLGSRRRKPTRVRWVMARVATRDLGQSWEATAQRLGMSKGAAFNLVERRRGDVGLEAAANEVAARIGPGAK